MRRIQEEDFSIEEEMTRVKKSSNRIGGIVAFLGTVRDFSKGQDVKKLQYEHYQKMAEEKLEKIRKRVLKDFDIIEVNIIHRVGEVGVGDNIVLIVVGAEHRKDAFKACEYCIDELKKVVPIWKKEYTADGEVWVEDHA